MGHSCDVCAELDVLLSFAEASRAYDYRRPEMVDEPVIDIVQGRYATAITVSFKLYSILTTISQSSVARTGHGYFCA